MKLTRHKLKLLIKESVQHNITITHESLPEFITKILSAYKSAEKLEQEFLLDYDHEDEPGKARRKLTKQLLDMFHSYEFGDEETEKYFLWSWIRELYDQFMFFRRIADMRGVPMSKDDYQEEVEKIEREKLKSIAVRNRFERDTSGPLPDPIFWLKDI